MKDITLKELLEAGCHFGHKKERWNPKAAKFIYEAREGIHIIDLVKTRDNLKKAGEFLENLGKEGRTFIIVATKRQAKGIVIEASKKSGANYLTNRWVGGFLTNWDEVKKNIDKMNQMHREKTDGTWQKKFLKHEIVGLEKELRKIDMVYGGVADLLKPPDAVFIVDVKREVICLKEAVRRGLPVIAIVDTNSDPTDVDYVIPANDDAIGSIQLIVNYLTDCYREGREMREKEMGRASEKTMMGGKVEEVAKIEKVEKKAEKVEAKVKKEKKPKKN